MSLPPPERAARTPWWFVALLILSALPSVFLIPEGAEVVEEAQWLGSAYVGWLYPAYIVVSGLCAYMCYPQRKALAWILWALIILTDIGLFILAL